MSIDPQHPQSPQPGGPMPVEDYFRLDQMAANAKYEYLDGSARYLSGGSVGHDRIARNTASAIEAYFASGSCTVFGSDVQVAIGVKSNGKEGYVYPDATVSCDVADRRRDNKLIRSPRIVIEVLSPSTESMDHGKKLDAYKACSTIQEILLISQFAQHIEIYRRNMSDASLWSYEIYNSGSIVELVSIDVRITMAEIYQGIDFDEPLIDERERQ
jgi:Uma2 family endonuclease